MLVCVFSHESEYCGAVGLLLSNQSGQDRDACSHEPTPTASRGRQGKRPATCARCVRPGSRSKRPGSRRRRSARPSGHFGRAVAGGAMAPGVHRRLRWACGLEARRLTPAIEQGVNDRGDLFHPPQTSYVKRESDVSLLDTGLPSAWSGGPPARHEPSLCRGSGSPAAMRAQLNHSTCRAFLCRASSSYHDVRNSYNRSPRPRHGSPSVSCSSLA